MLEFLRELCALPGTSGREDAVRGHITAALAGAGVPYEVDALGNVLVRRAGGRKIALFAHMDEVGYLVRHITPDGFLRVAAVGGIDPAAALGARGQVGERVGVFGVKPVHLLDADAKEKVPQEDALYLDIGATSRADAAERVQLGDAVTFARSWTQAGTRVLSPALDDRAGCAVLLDLLLHTDLPVDAAFTVQEEVGTRGAATAAYALAPKVALVLECTTAADLPSVPEGKKVCHLGDGAVLSFMDNGTIYDKELFALAQRVAAEQGIPAQVKTLVAGGNDAAAVHKSRAGVRTLALSVPCRYLHAPLGQIDLDDLTAVRNLTAAVVQALL
ncbi:MAG: M42 family peptidase [Oscillospiraceae bacterium]|jgi:endoglucanase|nr:M42 family peptidase [Oscillospiraceae bacterium]